MQQMAKIEEAAGISGRLNLEAVLMLLLTALTILLAIKPLADNSTVALSYLASGFDKAKKEALMFESHKHSYDSYIQLMEQMEKTSPKDIALVISGDGYDYPLWKMVKDRFPDARIRHIIVDDTKMETLDADSKALPDCILWIERGYKEIGTHLDYFGDVYTCGFVTDAPETCDGIFYYDSIVNGKSKPTLTAVTAP